MSFQSMLTACFSGSSRRRRAQRPRDFLPRLEALEDRAVPSTLPVTNLNDSGYGSLPAAVANAHNGDTIDFAHGLHGTITLSSTLSISAGVTIDGPGADEVAISGKDARRIFDISGSASVSISGLTLTDGRATAGGAILLEGSAALSLSDCTLTDNEALGTAAGGGYGGAIEDDSSATLTVDNSTFECNQAIAVGANDSNVSSTYIFASGGAIDLNLTGTGSATISDSTFVGNEARGGSAGASAGGGALSNSSEFGTTLTVTNCTISDNSAIGAAGGDGKNNFGSGQGGGINSIGALTVRDSTITNNLAQGAALASDVVPSQQVLSNTATAGGGIFCLDLATLNVASAPVIIAHTTASGNEAIGGSGPAPALAEGGGISLVMVASGLVTDCTVSGNTARGGSGNAGIAGADGVSGGIDLAGGAVVTVKTTTVSHNRAIGGTGGAGAAGGDGVGGAINVGTGILIFGPPDGSSLTLIGCALDGNRAIGGVGGSGSSGGNGQGGGLSILTSCSANVSTSTIRGNKADGGKAGAGGTDGEGVGGGVYHLGTFTADAFTVIDGNHASTSNDEVYP